MSTIYERIKQRRKELGLSADDVASSLGVSRATIYRYESSEIEKLPITILEPLAKILRTSPAYLMGWTNCELPIPSGDPQYNTEEQNLVNNYRELDERGKGAVQTTIEYELKVARSRLGTAPPSYSFAKASSRRNVPILGYTAAGAPIEAIEQEIDMPEGEDVPDRATLGLVVRGDSMEPVIKDGSIVWVDGTAIPHSGDIGVFLIDGEATCKKLVKVNGRYVLRSLNSAYDDIEPADWQDVRPVGKVVVPRKDYIFRAARDGSLGPITDPEGIYNNRVEGEIINKRVAQLKKEGKLQPHDEF